MNRNCPLLSAIVVLSLFGGCQQPGAGRPVAKAKKAAPASKKTTVAKKGAPASSTKASKDLAATKTEKKRPDGDVRISDFGTGAARNADRPEGAAVRKITTAIKESLELGPTLAVWVIDRTPSAEQLVSGATQAIQAFYESTEIKELSAAENRPLLTAVVAFDDQIQLAVDPPASDPQAVKAALDSIKPSKTGRELTFSALEKYLMLRTSERRELVITVITDEAGDDGSQVDDVIETARRNAIPIYVIGLPAPWGQTNPFAANPKAIDTTKTDDSLPIVGPESFLSERVDIDSLSRSYSRHGDLSLVDSGFGPFALERLCRASRGQFFAVRAEMGLSSFRGSSQPAWPTGSELRFDEKVVSKYAPDYVTEAEYRKLLAENKARAALCEAAKQPKVTIEGSPETRFAKAAEAKMAKKQSQAQQFAASNSLPVNRLAGILTTGEGDREKLTGLRWQAEFDLAIGRALANKARLDGYNSMIAALKRGKPFQNPNSKEWILEPADSYETDSTIKRMADKAKTYLERVVKEHPGTPWAKIAEEELQAPLGWTWKES
jgi:hypothetical protein